MNQRDILKYGHAHIEEAVKDLAGENWDKPGATTKWSIKDVISHLASFELAAIDIFKSLLDPSVVTPTLDDMKKGHEGFNDSEVAKRKDKTHEEVWKEYASAHEELMTWLEKIPSDLFTKVGTLPWYGSEYSLDDLIVYMNYGHKQEHMGHIQQFRKRENF